DEAVVYSPNDGSEGNTPQADIITVEANFNAYVDQAVTENQSLGVEVRGCVEFFEDTEDNDDDAPSFTNIIELLDSTPSTVS
ncbi:hypothetical protein A2U01_0090478, partial [Trifolium medium]|nr:hypothetical protein [Trifolium medium]